MKAVVYARTPVFIGLALPSHECMSDQYSNQPPYPWCLFRPMSGAEGHDHAASRSARCILLALQSSMSARRGDTVLLSHPPDRVPFLRRLDGESGAFLM